MAHFAKIGKGNIVVAVNVVNNEVITDANGVEQEQLGVDFLNNLFNSRDVWKQTSYNGNIRKNFAAIGFSYDQSRDAFIAPKFYESWVLNEDTCQWEAPVAKPELTQEQIDNNNYYSWNEETKQWDLNE
jgi:hypothetical protein